MKAKPEKEIDPKYYSTWLYSAVHIATSIETLRSSEDIAKYFGVPSMSINPVLQSLENWGLIEYKNQSWIYKSGQNYHLDDMSPLSRMNHLNWRNHSLSRPLSPSESINYTSIFSISKKDLEVLRAQLLAYIKNQRDITAASGSEEVVSFCCDFFKVSAN